MLSRMPQSSITENLSTGCISYKKTVPNCDNDSVLIEMSSSKQNFYGIILIIILSYLFIYIIMMYHQITRVFFCFVLNNILRNDQKRL